MPPQSGWNTTQWQVLLATILGICLGLLITALAKADLLCREHKEFLAFLQEWSNLEKVQQAVRNGVNNMSAISFVPKLDKRMTLLLMGVDSNGKHTQRFLHTRSDTMILLSADPASKTVGLVSIPRDSRVRIASGYGMDKINSAHALGGPKLAVRTVSEDFGIAIDRYVVVDVQGLKKLLAILGPAEVLVEKKMRYTDRAAGLNVALDPGIQTLTPVEMEEYVRFRHDQKGDIGRIERQQWFLRQVSSKLHDPTVLLKLPVLFKLAGECVETDLSGEEMAKLAQFGKELQPTQVKTAVLPGKSSFVHKGSYWIPDAYGAAIVFNRLLGTNLTASAAGNGLGLDRGEISSSDAYAAEPDVRYSVNPHAVFRVRDSIFITLKYAKGMDEAAGKLKRTLLDNGYKVRYVLRGDSAECAHEQIQQCSVRADDELTEQLRNAVPVLKKCPVCMNLDLQTQQDFTIVISPAMADLLDF